MDGTLGINSGLFLNIVSKSLLKQITRGKREDGTANELSVYLGEIIQKLMPRAEYIRFSTTGSEATMYAVRSGKSKN